MALEIADWHFFLNRIPDKPAQGTYRIFEPQWKEVILLWLGREDVEKAQKEQFIQALIEFDDGCWDFYRHRAYFLAAAGITEFDCTRADQIVAQIVKWGFGEFNVEKQQWRTFLEPIAEGAKAALPETDRTKAIAALVELINNSQDEDTRWRAAESLEQIGKDNQSAIAALVELINNSQKEYTRRQAASSLGQIDKDNQSAIAALVELINNSQDEFTRRQAAESLQKILADAQMAGVVTALKDCLSNETEESDFGRYRECYKVIWHCAQTMPYPAFYQAWHHPPLTPDPEMP